MADRTLRVLFVEDVEDDAEIAARALRHDGWVVSSRRVEEAPALEAALRREAWDLVLTDDAMPRFNARAAIDVARRISPDVPVVVLSGTMGEQAAVDAMRAGADDFVSKQNLPRLLPVVERAMREAESRRALRETSRGLAETADRLALVYRFLPAVILITTSDPLGRLRWVSDNVVRLSGFTATRMLEEPALWLSRVHPDDKAGVRRVFGGFDGGVASVEYRWQRADGVWRWFMHQAVTAYAEGERQDEILHLWVDVSERKEADFARADAQARLNFALRMSQTGGWDLDLVDQTAHRTIEHDRIFGYDELQPEWTYDTFLSHVVPEDRDAVEERFRAAIAVGSRWSFECRIRRADGAIRWIWYAGDHVRDDAGYVRRMAGIVQDITDRREAQEALADCQRQLSARGASA